MTRVTLLITGSFIITVSALCFAVMHGNIYKDKVQPILFPRAWRNIDIVEENQTYDNFDQYMSLGQTLIMVVASCLVIFTIGWKANSYRSLYGDKSIILKDNDLEERISKLEEKVCEVEENLSLMQATLLIKGVEEDLPLDTDRIQQERLHMIEQRIEAASHDDLGSVGYTYLDHESENGDCKQCPSPSASSEHYVSDKLNGGEDGIEEQNICSIKEKQQDVCNELGDRKITDSVNNYGTGIDSSMIEVDYPEKGQGYGLNFECVSHTTCDTKISVTLLDTVEAAGSGEREEASDCKINRGRRIPYYQGLKSVETKITTKEDQKSPEDDTPFVANKCKIPEQLPTELTKPRLTSPKKYSLNNAEREEIQTRRRKQKTYTAK